MISPLILRRLLTCYTFYKIIMNDIFERTELLFGKEAIKKLSKAKVAVFGVGGVGGYVIEALARSGIGELHIIDSDKVCASNINRQIIATNKTIGQYKVDVMEDRLKAINPNITVYKYHFFYLPETRTSIPFSTFDYIVDAIDTITAKIDIIMTAKDLEIPIISAMGCGNRIDPTKLLITDIYKTKNDPLAKVMRHELKKRNIKKLTVVASSELPIKPLVEIKENRKVVPGSTAFVPSCAGLIIASHVIKELIK